MVSLQLASLGLLLLVQWSAGVQHRPNMNCPTWGFESETDDSIRLTAKGFHLMKNMGKLYMKMWDPNQHEITKFKCIRMKLNLDTMKYQLAYVDANNSPKLLSGDAEYKVTKRGVALDIHNGLTPHHIFQTAEQDNIRIQLRDVTSNEIMCYACWSYLSGINTYQRYDASYYFSTINDDSAATVTDACAVTTFTKYFVPNGAMKKINQAECEGWYSAAGGDQITLV